MEDNNNNLIKNENHIKRIYRLHLSYICIICAFFVIVTICIIPDSISDFAFQNFSFASTIVSIVLALVSIVYSLWSGKSSNSQYDSIRHIERQIDKQLDSFNAIDISVSSTLSVLKEKLNSIHKDQNENFKQIKDSAFIGKNIYEEEHSIDKFDINLNASAANICLLSFCLSSEHKKCLPRTILNKYLQNYWMGYLMGLSNAIPDKIKYEKQNDQLKITFMDTKYFGSSIVFSDWIRNNTSQFEEMSKELNTYFKSDL